MGAGKGEMRRKKSVETRENPLRISKAYVCDMTITGS